MTIIYIGLAILALPVGAWVGLVLADLTYEFSDDARR
jgi:hypothetical protein